MAKGYGSETGRKFPYDSMAENALFLISCTTSLDAGKLKKINAERAEKGEPEISEGQNAQRLLHELEVEGFGLFGCGVADLLKAEIAEETPLHECVAIPGMRPLISDFELKLKQGLGKTKEGQAAWLDHYRHYSTKTKFGVLIVAGDAKFFQCWAQSRACREEVENVPEDRLFAYLDGCLVRVNKPESSQLWTSHRTGQGSIVWSTGDLYQGALKKGKQHGLGHHFFPSGDVYSGSFVDGSMEGNAAKYLYANGDSLEGSWKSGKPILEKCRYTFADGRHFQGKWPEKGLDAKGIQEFASGGKVGSSEPQSTKIEGHASKVQESKEHRNDSAEERIPKAAEDASADAAEAQKYRDIIEAAEKGNLAAVRHFVAKDAAAVKAKDSFGFTALHEAAGCGDWPDVCRFLLERGADVEAANRYGWTPLHYAAAKGHVETAKVLLEFKADIHAKDRRGRTAMDLAKQFRETVLVKLLEEAQKRSR